MLIHSTGCPHLGTTKVAELELVRCSVDQQILRLDVPVAHALGVDVSQRAAHLRNNMAVVSATLAASNALGLSFPARSC